MARSVAAPRLAPSRLGVGRIGGMGALYATPLYASMHHSAAPHFLVHIHFLAAGWLFTWAIIGRDPGPRPSHAYRLGILFLSMGIHAALSKALVAYGWPEGHAPREIEQAAQLMYYGGDLAELLLVIVLMADWSRAWDRWWPHRRGEAGEFSGAGGFRPEPRPLYSGPSMAP